MYAIKTQMLPIIVYAVSHMHHTPIPSSKVQNTIYTIIAQEGEVCTQPRRGGSGKKCGPLREVRAEFSLFQASMVGLVTSSSKNFYKTFLDLCVKIPMPNFFSNVMHDRSEFMDFKK